MAQIFTNGGYYDEYSESSLYSRSPIMGGKRPADIFAYETLSIGDSNSIGGYNADDLVLLLSATALANGEKRDNQYSGKFPLADGTSTPAYEAEMFNYVSGEGYDLSEKAIVFDGVNTYLNIRDVTQLNGVPKFTIEYWVKFTTTTGTQVIVSKKLDNNNRILNRLVANNFEIRVNNGAESYGAFAVSGVFGTSAYHHVVIDYDGTLTGNANRLKVYVDDVQQTLSFTGTIPSTSSASMSGTDLLVGDNGSKSIKGNIDDYAVYSNALGASRISDNYNLGRGKGLYGYSNGPVAELFSSQIAASGIPRGHSCFRPRLLLLAFQR